MTLHEAIRDVLLNNGRPLLPLEIAILINDKQLYKRNDGQPVSASQISARINQYKNNFKINADGTIQTIHLSITILKNALEKISLELQGSKQNSEYFYEVLIPVCAIYFQFGNPIFNILAYAENFKDKFVRDLQELNQTEHFNELLNSAIRIAHLLEGDTVFMILSVLNGAALDMKGNRIDKKEFKSFFNELINEYSWKQKFNSSLGSTPSSISNLISKLIKLQNYDVIFDPFTGKSSMLTAITEQNNNINNFKIIAGDINENAVDISRLNFAVNEIANSEVLHKNAFLDWLDKEQFADWYITNPPFGLKAPLVKYEYTHTSNSRDVVLISIGQALYHLKSTGRAIIVVPESLIFSTSKSYSSVRRYLIENNLLQGIISLPAGLYKPYSGIKTSLLILDKGRKGRNEDDIFYYDASHPAIFEETEDIIRCFHNRELCNTNICNYIPVNSVMGYYSFDFRKDFESYHLIGEVNQKPIKHFVKKHFSGNAVKSSNLNNQTGIPFLQISNLSNYFQPFIYTDSNRTKFISDPELIPGVLKYIPKNAILIAKSGEKLKPTLFRGEKALCSSNILVLELDENRILPEYFITEMHQPHVLDQLLRIRKGAGITSFSVADFQNIKIVAPDISSQKKAIDIHYNNLINRKEGDQDTRYIIGELKHKLKGPLGGLDSGIKTLELYLKEKEKSGSPLSMKDITVNQLPTDTEETLKQYSLLQLLKRISLNIKRIDDNLRRADTLAKIGTEDPDMEDINIVEFIKYEIVPNYQNRIKINLAINSEQKNEMIRADKILLHMIFDNIIDNAIVHGFKNRPGETSSINIRLNKIKSTDKNTELIEVMVENNGEPLPEGFTREILITKGNTTNGSNGSTGIGGSLIEKALKTIGGELLEVVNSEKKLDFYKTKYIFSLQLSY